MINYLSVVEKVSQIALFWLVAFRLCVCTYATPLIFPPRLTLCQSGDRSANGNGYAVSPEQHDARIYAYPPLSPIAIKKVETFFTLVSVVARISHSKGCSSLIGWVLKKSQNFFRFFSLVARYLPIKGQRATSRSLSSLIILPFGTMIFPFFNH